MTFAIITTLIVMAIGLVAFILIVDRNFMALNDRIERQGKDLNALRIASSNAAILRLKYDRDLRKKMRDEDPHHKIDIIFDKLETLWKREKATEDQEARLDALVFQISKKDAVAAEALSTLSDEVSALRQMRGAKR